MENIIVNDNIPEIIESKKIKAAHNRNFNENDYKVYDGYQIEEKMINEIDLLDKQFFKEEHLWETNYQLQLFNKNKNSLIMVKYNNECVGYLNYLVITKEKYDQMINSNVIIDEFDFDEVTIFYKNKENYLTINSVVVDKEHQDSYVVKILTKNLKKF